MAKEVGINTFEGKTLQKTHQALDYIELWFEGGDTIRLYRDGSVKVSVTIEQTIQLGMEQVHLPERQR